MFTLKSCVYWVVIMTFALVNVGCGAIFGGSRQTVHVDASPSGVSVIASPGGIPQMTPTTFNLERKENYVLIFEKEGYESKKVEIQRGIRGGILALDIIFTGLVGVIVDAATGSWYKLSPESVSITLVKKGGASLDLPETIHISLSVGNANRDTHELRVTSSVPGVSVHVEPAHASQR